MNELLQDLTAHQAWADAEHWRALEAHPGALNDGNICERLQHYHLTQALAQVAMHSHYHRGQNATRLRENGGQPPTTTDLITWYWKGRPSAVLA